MSPRSILVATALATLALPAAAACQLGGSGCGDPGAIDCNGGAVCFFPWRLCTGCTCVTTGLGKTCLASGDQPGTVATLAVTKSATTEGDLDLAWSPSCSASQPDYAVHEGSLGQWYTHAPSICSTAGSQSTTLTASGGNRYYLVVPIAGTFTGSFGTSTANGERPDASPSCTDDRALSPCP
jgi:hypothetical protein